MGLRAAVVISDAFLRRLAPALASLARQGSELRIIDIHRPFPQIRSLLAANRPEALLTEWLPEVTSRLLRLEYPTVIADTDDVFPGAVSIDVDDHAIGVSAAEYFLQAGYRHFAYVGLDRPYSAQRLAGYRARLAEAGCHCEAWQEREPRHRHYMEIWQEPPRALRDWLKRLSKPAAAFTAHDPLGRLVCEAARDSGVSVPEDLAVLGANNDELVCPLSHPPLSSIVIPWDRIGAAAGERMQMLRQGLPTPPQPILIAPGGVAPRQSTTLSAVDDIAVRRMLQYLRENFAQPVTIAIACRDLRLSRRAVERRFAEHLRASPWQVLCRFRVNKARSLLASTALPISRVAEACGFGDAERFAVVFRRLAGTSPSGFRKASE